MTAVQHWIPSPHHSSRAEHKPEVLVVHFTAGNGEAVSLGRFFQMARRKAASHYGISRDGTIAQYVSESRSAWHAGDGLLPKHLNDVRSALVDNVNRRSIGVELCNRGWAPSRKGRPRLPAKHRNPRSTSDSWEEYPIVQIDALVTLASEMMARHPTLKFCTGHEDVTNYVTAGGSKLDPGPLFPWERLVATGLKRLVFDFKEEAFAL